MFVDQLPAENAKPAARGDKVVGYDEYIDTQIRHTRRMVKAVDIATGLVVLTTGVLVFLLVATAAEDWLVPGGFGTLERSLLFAVLAISVGQHLYRRVWPLLVRPINPVFAAQTIERSSPSLKNSLLNLLLFRERRSDVTDAVYETLEQQAAQRLTRVSVESAVDRTHLIRLGYTLVAVVAACALYKIFSPKDPVIAVERVLMPWADIVPASRVSITDVEPGSTTIARGEMLPISAEVSGVGEDDPVVVRYTTADGQAVEKAVTMKPSASGLRYSGQLPAASEPGRPTGVAQNLRYRIEAGDARSHVYSVTVVAAPTITVERVDYDYPTYTGIADRSVEGLGDIRAIEGTRVTIHARANEPIEEASIDFEADGRRDVRMTVKDDIAESSFVLALRDDHQAAKYTSYALRFKGTDGRSNRDPVTYPIDVLPDYAPEVSILAPKEKVRDVRLDETVLIEVEARDPDFELSEVRLKGDAAGRTVLDESLLSKEQSGRFTGRFQVTPAQHGLKAGDVLQYWVAARDNRTPQPNEVKSEQQTLRIASPGPNQQQPPDRLAERDHRAPQPGNQQRDQSRPGDAQNDQQQPGDGKQSSNENRANQPPQDGTESRDQNKGQASGDKSQKDRSQGGQSKDGQSQSTQPMDGESKGGESNDGKSNNGQSDNGKSSGENQQDKGNSSQQQQPGGSESGGGHDKSQKQPGPPSAGGNGTSEKNSESSPAGESQNSSGNQGGSKGQPNGRAGNKGGDSSSSQDQRDSTGGSGTKGGHEQIKPSDSPSQVSPEGDNDGEAFDRIQKFLKKQGELRDPSGNDKQAHDDQPTSNNSQRGKSGSGSKAQSSGGKTPPSEGTSGAEKSPDGKNAARQGDQAKKSEGGKQSGDGNSGGEKQPREGAKDEQVNQSKQGGEASGKNGDRAENGRQGEKNTDQGQQAEDAAKGAPSAEQPGKNARGADKDSGSLDQPGSEKKPDDSANKQTNPQMPMGQPTQSKGENGGGQPTKHDTGSPDVNHNLKPEDKWQQSNEKKSGDGEEPPSGTNNSTSKREKDSQGEHGGTQAGGGTQGGGGQRAPHEGTGSSGENQSADEGTGESSEHGKGHNSPGAGKDAKSDQRTGQSGSNEAGNGSDQREGQGSEPGGKPGDAGKSSNSKSGDNKSSDRKSPGENKSEGGEQSGDKANDLKQHGDQGGKDGKSQSGNPSKDGKQPQGQPDGKSGDKSADKSDKGGEQSQPGTKQSPGSQPDQSGGGSSSSNNGTPGMPLGAGGPTKTDAKAPEADAANLEYARKQTDLVVETLAEQMKRNKVDKRLLDELGWSEQDLKRFVERWQQLKQAAKGNTPAADAAQKELDDALRSLGLQHGNLQQAKVKEDSVRDLHEGYHGPVPLEYQERLRAYNQGVSRARQDGE
jgi:hypothetical protein